MNQMTSRYNLMDFSSKHTGLVSKSILDKLEEYEIKADEAQFIRKGIIPTAISVKGDEGDDIADGENAVISYITTATPDRDREIVLPGGAKLEAYMKHPVVLFGHDYFNLPIGKAEWVRTNPKGLYAKTIYYDKGFAKEVYDYRKAGFPLAESIGFIPLDIKEIDDKGEAGVERIFTEWILLEYSDVAIPANPEALQIAVGKGLKPIESLELMKEPSQVTVKFDNDTFIHFTKIVERERAKEILSELKEIHAEGNIANYCQEVGIEVLTADKIRT